MHSEHLFFSLVLFFIHGIFVLGTHTSLLLECHNSLCMINIEATYSHKKTKIISSLQFINSIAIISKTQEKGNEVNSKSTDEEKFHRDSYRVARRW